MGSYRLYPEIEKFINFCGLLCSHLKPKNTLDSEYNQLHAAFNKAITLYYIQVQRVALEKRKMAMGHPNIPKPQFEEFIWNSKELKREFHKWLGAPLGVKQYDHRESTIK